MTMLETAGLVPGDLNRFAFRLKDLRNGVREWIHQKRKYHSIRHDLGQYSSHELEELGISKSNIDTVAYDLAQGRPTFCHFKKIGHKRILSGGS